MSGRLSTAFAPGGPACHGGRPDGGARGPGGCGTIVRTPEVPVTEALQPLDETWERALAVVAHPDDLEFGAAAAVARWTDQGKQVAYCLVTSGEAGIDAMEPETAGPLREDEQRESARLVGVDVVDFLGFPDGVIEEGLPLRRAIAREVRRHRPDVVITNNFRETWDGATTLNQADHIAVGRAALDAVRDAGNRWVFRDLADEGVEPWNGVRQVWAAASPDSRHAVDVTATFDRGVASLRAHDAYLRGLGTGTFDPEEFLESIARPVGARLGVPFAASFEVFDLQSW
jgi:LmbE family N-acetylglucosaminyl deacetylase